jgi:hypothetical protein
MALATVPHLVSLSHTFYQCPDLGRCSAYTKACETAIAKKCPELGTIPYDYLKSSGAPWWHPQRIPHFSPLWADDDDDDDELWRPLPSAK